MTLSRRDLEEGRMREVYIEALAEGHALTDEQLSESLTATLNAKPKGAGWWVFAYGSLLWNPLFPFAESRPASLHGLHRRFCLWSLASRGKPDAPGLVLGLDRGGSCRGVVYRLPAPCAIDELHLLWRREMVTGAYAPRWLHVESEGRPVIALGFVVRRVRIVRRLSRAHARGARDPRHHRSLSRAAGGTRYGEGLRRDHANGGTR